jgi:hypothetical protein
VSADPRFLKLRLAAGKDPTLSDGAFRLLCCLIDWFYTSPYSPTEAFPLTWSTVRRWCAVEKDQAYRRISLLVDRGILRKGELRGCPAMMHYFWGSSWRINAATGSGINAATGSGINAATSFRQKAADHISNPFRRECTEKEEKKSRPPAGARKAPEDESAAPDGAGRKTTPGGKKTTEDYIRELRAAVDPPGTKVAAARHKGGNDKFSARTGPPQVRGRGRRKKADGRKVPG